MHYSAESLPFVLEFFTDHTRGNTKQVKEFWNRGGVSPKSFEDLLPVKEAVPIGVRLYARDGYEPDPVGKMVIESSIYSDDGDPVFLEVNLSNSLDQTYIFKHERQQVFPWRLGVYYFEVHYNGKIYSSAILVVPIHLSKEQVQHMHLVLEQEIEGISYELVFTSKSTGNEYEILNSKLYYDYVLKLMNEKDRLYAALTNLERNLKTEVRTAYTVNTYERKVDSKSLRWKEMSASPYALNKKKTLVIDIPVNQWIKHILQLWKNELNHIGEEIQTDWEKQQHIIKSSEEEKKQHEERINSWIYNREVSKESKDSVRSIIYRLNDVIKKADKQRNILAKWMEIIKNVHGRISYTLSSTELSQVSRSQRKPELKDMHYRLIHDLYDQSKKSLIGEERSNHFIRVLKPTWKVYEQFVFFQMVEILRRVGFSVRSVYNIDELRELPSGFCMELESEEFIVHVWYDKVIYMPEDAKARGEFFFLLA
ncbi:hypothetical protein MT997_28465 [Paenibacillus sp. OVF10]|nr:hypothetical protein MT997_28465 [Paenibacillus sp. OVF10]